MLGHRAPNQGPSRKSESKRLSGIPLCGFFGILLVAVARAGLVLALILLFGSLVAGVCLDVSILLKAPTPVSRLCRYTLRSEWCFVLGWLFDDESASAADLDHLRREHR